MSDPAGITAPKDPAAYRRPRAASVGFLAAFGLVCVLVGAAAAVYAPRLLGPPKAAGLATPAADLTVPATPAIPTMSVPAPEAPAAASEDVARLDARVAALESQEGRVNQAAAAALAAAAVMEAAQSSRPFTAELAALRAASPGVPELAALARIAETGAPSRAALAASFPDYAARAAVAGHAPGEGAALGARVGYALMRIVTVRRVGETAGDTPDARLARAERLVQDGDIDGALRALDRLSPAAREAVAPWRVQAERRAEIDRLAGALRVRALRALSATGAQG